ncbi:LapB repeat-containing protein [Culicoidibacter larvae]|uniref:DUF5011 domain-containing protein n=1 Tax=Culicoidibacter larvae TaxID=2579976 RepID=A0A5R8Q9Y0_9FIRM|nr:LapB repeat-containing protein [Culicoidibacter larvae]TLG72726.1 DUF5011 domain-containing protein [Culicoidibacter larvae]
MRKVIRLVMSVFVILSGVCFGVVDVSAADNTADVSATKHAVVENYVTLHEALLDADVKEITIMNNITLENVAPIVMAVRDLVIHGNGFTLTEGNTLQSRIQVGSGMQLTVNDLVVRGRNSYGTFAASTGLFMNDTVLIFNNYHYSGPQMVYNPGGTTIFRGQNSAVIQRQGVGGMVSDEPGEVGEVSKLVFEANSGLAVESVNAGSVKQHSVFWFRGLNQELSIGKGAQLDINYPEAFALFYQYDKRPLHLSEGAQVAAKTEDILYGGYAFSGVTLEADAHFKFTATSSYGSLHSLGDIELGIRSRLQVAVGGKSAPLTLANNVQINVGDGALLNVARNEGNGIFSESDKHYSIDVSKAADITSLQDGSKLFWRNLTANITFDNGDTAVESTDLTIDGQLHLVTSSDFAVLNKSDGSGPMQSQELVYELGVQKSEQDFYNDLELPKDEQVLFSSDYDLDYVQALGTYAVLVRVDNQSDATAYFVDVTIHVVDTTAPIISVDKAVAAQGITYYMPVARTEAQFLTDIVAKTDDGSPVNSDFATKVNQQTVGTYNVTLTAVDASGNTAAPRVVTVFIVRPQTPVSYVIVANSFSTYSSGLTGKSAADVNAMALDASNARVVEVISNTRIKDGLWAEVDGQFSGEEDDVTTSQASVVTNSGSHDYRSPAEYVYTDNNGVVADAATEYSQDNSFFAPQRVMIYGGIAALVSLILLGIYLVFFRK